MAKANPPRRSRTPNPKDPSYYGPGDRDGRWIRDELARLRSLEKLGRKRERCEDPPIALVDMDGTICDTDQVLRRELTLIAGPNEPDRQSYHRDEAPQYIVNREALIKRKVGFWRNLPRLQLGFDVLGVLKELGYFIHILTRASADIPTAWSEKVEWCGRELAEDLGHPGRDYKIAISQDKGLVYGKALIEDWPPYIADWLAHRPRGKVVLIDQPHNKGLVHPQILRYDGTNLSAVKEFLQIARRQ